MNGGMLAIGKAEAGQDEQRIDDEEIRREGLLLRLADGRDQQADAERAEKEERGSEQQDERIADERHLEPERADRGDQHDLGEPDQEERHGLAEDELERPDRRHHDLLERADLALAHDGEGGEVDDHHQRQRADHAGHEEPAAVEVGIVPGPLLERDRGRRQAAPRSRARDRSARVILQSSRATI